MNNVRNKAGFTMAELLIVVAILVVLFAVAFIGIVRYLKSSERLEYNTIAKEIFIAAQNHLTTAKSQGYLGLDDSLYGDRDEDEDYDVFYYVVDHGTARSMTDDTKTYSEIFKLMLPFGSIDDTVRLGGSYLIRYQPSTARVLDVFYSNENGRYGTSLLDHGHDITYDVLMEHYKGDNPSDDYVIGWYGDADALEYGERLQAPTIEIKNAEKLEVIVTDYNYGIDPLNLIPDGQYLKLIITGTDSGQEAEITLYGGAVGTRVTNPESGDNKFTVVLDDITQSNLHFCDIDSNLRPGENIKIQAVTSNSSVLTNVARSVTGECNSLFAKLYTKEKQNETNPDTTISVVTADIANIRHLENLDYFVSHVDYDHLAIEAADQISDLIWNDGTANSFTQKAGNAVVPKEGTVLSTGFYPVSTINETINEDYNYPIDYDGENHSISGLVVSSEGNAGVFGTMDGGSVSNLLVYGGTVSSTGSDTAAGGLIGSMTDTQVSKCASTATVKAESGGTAGGLIGEAVSTSNQGTEHAKVEACYAAGHTKNGAYEDWISGTSYNGYDVVGTTAGGLIGIVSGPTTVQYSYSTCSVNGVSFDQGNGTETAPTFGGFAGSAGDGCTIQKCYCTGLVGPDNVDSVNEIQNNAFLGISVGSNNTIQNNHFFEIINEVEVLDENDNVTRIVYREPGCSAEAFDTNLSKFEAFVSYNDGGTAWDVNNKPAKPYDTTLAEYYHGKYVLRTVAQLGASNITDKDVVYTHYGDWPAPEYLVKNVKNTNTQTQNNNDNSGENSNGGNG